MKLRTRLLIDYAVMFVFAFFDLLLLNWLRDHLQSTLGGGFALALTAVLSIAFAAWLALTMARLLSRQLERIAEAARLVAAGRFEARVDEAPLIETRSLAMSFNQMAEALETYNATSLGRLVAEQRRSEAVLDSIDDGLIILDSDARIERMNPVASLQLDRLPANCVGKTLDELLAETIGSRHFDARVRECITTQQSYVGPELELALGVAPLRRILAASLWPFPDVSRPGLVVVVRDVTANRRFDALRTEFVLRASHELRTPLAGLRMGLDLLAERSAFPEGSREADLLETTRGETQRMSRLIDDLLDVARLQAGGASLTLAWCEPEALLDQAMQRFAPVAAEQGVELLLKAAPQSLPPLRADATAVSRVLDNLIGNALRHTPSGGSVILSAEREIEHLALRVSDSGRGIAPAQLARIFEPFVQVGGNTGGAGLGLTLCREIVEHHGGRIDADAYPGRGATFTARLPWNGPDAHEPAD